MSTTIWEKIPIDKPLLIILHLGFLVISEIIIPINRNSEIIEIVIYKNLKTEPVNVYKTFSKHSAELVERVGKIKNKLDEQIFLFPILHILDFLKSTQIDLNQDIQRSFFIKKNFF